MCSCVKELNGIAHSMTKVRKLEKFFSLGLGLALRFFAVVVIVLFPLLNVFC